MYLRLMVSIWSSDWCTVSFCLSTRIWDREHSQSDACMHRAIMQDGRLRAVGWNLLFCYQLRVSTDPLYLYECFACLSFWFKEFGWNPNWWTAATSSWGLKSGCLSWWCSCHRFDCFCGGAMGIFGISLEMVHDHMRCYYSSFSLRSS